MIKYVEVDYLFQVDRKPASIYLALEKSNMKIGLTGARNSLKNFKQCIAMSLT